MANTNNLNYIIKEDLKILYGFVPDADQTTEEENKTDLTTMAIAIASERINSICGNLIEETGFNNLNESQKQLVKRATARMTIYYLHEGMSYLRASVSVSGNGLSSSVSPPSEPDYVLTEVYNLLQQANLHIPRKAINSNIGCYNDNFNNPSIYDESDTRVITWDSGNKTFLQKQGLIAGNGIKIEDVSDTIPKIKITSNGGTTDLTDYYKKEETNNLLENKQDKLLGGHYITVFTDSGGKKVVDIKNSDMIRLSTELLATMEFDTLDTKKKQIISAINENSESVKTKQDIIESGQYVSILDSTTTQGKKQIDISKEQLLLLGKQVAEIQTFTTLKTSKKDIINAINENYKKTTWIEVGQKGDYRTWEYRWYRGYMYRIYYSWEDISTGPPGAKLIYFVAKFDEPTDQRTLILDRCQVQARTDQTSFAWRPEILELGVSSTGVFINIFQKGTNPTVRGNILKVEQGPYAFYD